MKPKYLILLAAVLFASLSTSAQRGYVKRAIEKDMEKKHADPQRQKGKSELEKITYENDKRYKDPNNKVQATIVFEDKELNKKGEVKKTSVQRMVFGKHGECIVSNEGEKDEGWMVFNYADKANYMVTLRDKKAMKMPLVNMQKMAEASAKREMEKTKTEGESGWKATGEKQVINGYNCSRYTYTYSSNPHYSSFDMWVSPEVKLDLGDNYMMGARLNSYKYNGVANKDYPNGFMVRTVLYNKKGLPVSQRDLKEFKKSADEKYFDMSQFTVTDVMSLL